MWPSKKSSSPTSASRSSKAGGGPPSAPLGRSNFAIDWGGRSASNQAFAEVIFPPFVLEDGADSAPSQAATISDAPALARHLVLRRGATGTRDLYDWWDLARRGQAPRRRTVTVRLLGSDGRTVLMTWRFRNA